MFVFAVAIGAATFIENDYGTITAKALIFNSWWLELCLFLLTTIFIYNIFIYKLYNIRKLPVLFLHLSFILIIIGAAITRYTGSEGMMRIREGNLNNQFVSSTTFLTFKVHNNETQYVVDKPLLLSSISNNKFSIPNYFGKTIKIDNKKIKVEYLDFIQDPVDQILENQKDGYDVLELVVPAKSGGMQSEYIAINRSKEINDLLVSFNTDVLNSKDLGEVNSDFLISKSDSSLYFISIYDVEYMKMSNQSKGVLEKQTRHLLNTKTLYTINGKNMVFKNYFNNSIITKSTSSIKNDDNTSDLLKVKLFVADRDTIIDLYGTRGLISPKSYFTFNGLFFSFSYGSKNYSLPFAIFLKDFQLERYPGSNSPSSFASEIEVIDGEDKMDYRIFMNNVLNYRGYRFFQSSYDDDEKGTILSVNKDKAGTIFTYIGYLSLLLSVISVLLSRFSRFNLLNKNIKKE